MIKTVELHFESGEVRETKISNKVSNEEIEVMGMNEYFNLGTGDKDDMQLCVKVVIKNKGGNE